MFTGIVETVGTVRDVSERGPVRRLTIDVGDLGVISIGASIAVSGTCLTAIDSDIGSVTVEIVEETLRRTVLGQLEIGSKVNLERAMAASGRFDGHVVQGHVDGVGTVLGVARNGDTARVTIRVPRDLMRFIVEKGSITVDGVSLTVASLGDDSVDIALIPHTLDMTTLGAVAPGDGVNLEVDVLAKYVERLTAPSS